MAIPIGNRVVKSNPSIAVRVFHLKLAGPESQGLFISPVILMKIGVFILMRGPGKAIRNCHENSQFSYT